MSNASPFPWHYFPNTAAQDYFMICAANKLMEGDICWNMSEDTWGPIDKKDIGKSNTRYMRLARPIVNSMVNRARRNKDRIKWQRMTKFKHCCPLLLKLGNGSIVMGRTQSIGPRYNKSGWFQDIIKKGEHEYHTTSRRLYPVAWAELLD